MPDPSHFAIVSIVYTYLHLVDHVIVNLTLPPDIQLYYLRGPICGLWEVTLRKPLPCHPNTLRYAVGFGADRDPNLAITEALVALERDPQLLSVTLGLPTCASPLLDDALTNLLTAPKLRQPAPKFKFGT